MKKYLIDTSSDRINWEIFRVLWGINLLMLKLLLVVCQLVLFKS